LRNLNPNQEFLIQIALFKVDSDMNGRIGKYFTASGLKPWLGRRFVPAK